MSEISLYSGLYETIRRWADLVDDLLVSLKAEKPYPDPESCHALQEIFASLGQADNANADFSDTRVASLIESKLGHKIKWQELAENLADPLRRPRILPTLEAIAGCLAEQHAETVAKMRWGHP